MVQGRMIASLEYGGSNRDERRLELVSILKVL